MYCKEGWVDFGLFTISTKLPLRVVTYHSKITKIATTKIIFFFTQ
jgi:hypothetical protein